MREIFGSRAPDWPISSEAPYIARGGKELTIRELIEEQRRLLGSSDPMERFVAAVLVAGALRERLCQLRDAQVGQLLEDEVCPTLSVVAPESTLCDEAVDRLCRLKLAETADRPACPECGGDMHLRFGIDEPDAWECGAASCGRRLQAEGGRESSPASLKPTKERPTK